MHIMQNQVISSTWLHVCRDVDTHVCVRARAHTHTHTHAHTHTQVQLHFSVVCVQDDAALWQ